MLTGDLKNGLFPSIPINPLIPGAGLLLAVLGHAQLHLATRKQHQIMHFSNI